MVWFALKNDLTNGLDELGMLQCSVCACACMGACGCVCERMCVSA